jgi:hypothetical protein
LTRALEGVKGGSFRKVRNMAIRLDRSGMYRRLAAAASVRPTTKTQTATKTVTTV